MKTIKDIAEDFDLIIQLKKDISFNFRLRLDDIHLVFDGENIMFDPFGDEQEQLSLSIDNFIENWVNDTLDTLNNY